MRLKFIFTIVLLLQYFVGNVDSEIVNINFNYGQFKEHHTAAFYTDPRGVSNVILRRGQQFKLQVELDTESRNLNAELKFTFKTRVDQMDISLPSKDQKGWKYEDSKDRTSITAKIHIPANAPVGEWTLQVSLKDKNNRLVERYRSPNKIVVLFNPWVKEDAVYLGEKRLIDEYVLNEDGVLFAYQDSWSASSWLYNQFKPGVLAAVLFVLDRTNLNAKQRGDVVLVSREFTYLLNTPTRHGQNVISGKWTEPLNETSTGEPATSPVEWTGSAPILLKYYWSRGKSVKYGQCWVFAGVLTTIYRALGIPARSVANANSAHDYDKDLTLDTYLTKDGFRARGSDRLWNYHAWTQAWFRRNDITSKYDGWQNLDATPQEVSERRLHEVGPASSNAILRSDLKYRYQTDFLYSEINADEVIWRNKKVVSIETNSVGLAVMTKDVGSNRAVNIVSTFKPTENTPEERLSYRRAAASMNIRPVSLRSNISIHSRSAKTKVLVDLNAPRVVPLGSTLQFNVSIRNRGSLKRNVRVGVKVTSIYYNGRDAGVILMSSQEVSLLGGKSKYFNYAVSQNKYIKEIKDFQVVRIEVVALMNDDIIEWTETKVSFKIDDLAVKYPATVNVNQAFQIQVKLKNPLIEKLTNCRLQTEGNRIENKVIRIHDIKPGASHLITITVRAEEPMEENVVITFHSNEVREARGVAKVKVVGKVSRKFALLVPLSENDNYSKSKLWKEEAKEHQKQYEQYEKTQQQQFGADEAEQLMETEVTSNKYGRVIVEF